MISGKARDQCVAALRAAKGNPDIAFEYLLAGVPLGGAEGGAIEEGGDDYGDEEGSE